MPTPPHSPLVNPEVCVDRFESKGVLCVENVLKITESNERRPSSQVGAHVWKTSSEEHRAEKIISPRKGGTATRLIPGNRSPLPLLLPRSQEFRHRFREFGV